MIYSAGSYAALKEYGDAFYFVKKQAVALIIGIVCMVAVSRIRAEKLKKLAIPALVLSFILLAVIFIPGVGVESYGAKRWIDLGITTIQPSEIAKFGFVLFAAARIAKKGTSTVRGMLPVLGAGLCACALIMLEPNMSVTICLGAVMLLMLTVGGTKGKHFVLLALPLCIAAVILVFAEPYRIQRLMAFIDPWQSPRGEGYQLIQSYYALGSGGFFGVGLFNSRQKYLFLPFSESDFIFSVIGEELGFFGAVVLIGVYAYLIYSGYKVAANATDRFSSALVFGITSVIAVQSAINMAVVTGVVPPTGLPLPFISYGGSSLVCFLAAVGVIVSVAKNNCGGIGSALEKGRKA